MQLTLGHETGMAKQKMPFMAAQLPRPAADGLYLTIPVPYPHFGAYQISNIF